MARIFRALLRLLAQSSRDGMSVFPLCEESVASFEANSREAETAFMFAVHFFSMTDKKRFRVFATSRIGDPAESRLRERGYELEVFQGPETPPKKRDRDRRPRIGNRRAGAI